MEILIIITGIIMLHKDITEAVDIGEMTDIIIEMILIIIMITAYHITITTIIIQEEKYISKDHFLQSLQGQIMASEILRIMEIIIMEVLETMVRIATKDQITVSEAALKVLRITAEDSEIIRTLAQTLIPKGSGITQAIQTAADSGMNLQTTTGTQIAEGLETVQDQIIPPLKTTTQTEVGEDLGKTFINKRTNS